MTSRAGQWRVLLIVTRVMGAAAALVLLALHHVTSFDGKLGAATVAYTAVTCGSIMLVRQIADQPAFWVLDTAGALALIYLSGDWRSPFYVVGLSSLILPASSLDYRRAVAWGFSYTGLYIGVGIATQRLASRDLQSAIRMETAATHIILPLVFTVLLAYASVLLDRLSDERERSERLAVQSERQRIAWELHDSAKQRVHAAHLLLSAIAGRADHDPTLEQALEQVRAATADMETSVAELRTPLEDRPLDAALRERAGELAHVSPASIVVDGEAPLLPPVTASHVYRIAAEAMSNAVRHAGAQHIEVTLDSANGHVVVLVADDGSGIPEELRPGATGLRIMRDRAATIGADLDVEPGLEGRGTTVRLTVPTTDPQREDP